LRKWYLGVTKREPIKSKRGVIWEKKQVLNKESAEPLILVDDDYFLLYI